MQKIASLEAELAQTKAAHRQSELDYNQYIEVMEMQCSKIVQQNKSLEHSLTVSNAEIDGLQDKLAQGTHLFCHCFHQKAWFTKNWFLTQQFRYILPFNV